MSEQLALTKGKCWMNMKLKLTVAKQADQTMARPSLDFSLTLLNKNCADSFSETRISFNFQHT